jgi:hypothetical protein
VEEDGELRGGVGEGGFVDLIISDLARGILKKMKILPIFLEICKKV